jgi:peptidyl-prolyl cis-trans isomerase B (cyclophilin B)
LLIKLVLVAAFAAACAELVTEEAVFKTTIGGEPAGDIKIGLFGQTVPKTVKNFVTLCNPGLDGKSYAGTPFHRVIRNFMIQGGDVATKDGTGSTSIYGRYFDDEGFTIKHTGPGLLSMANAGVNTNGCQFFITAIATPWLDGHHVVFGKVVRGMETIRNIEAVRTGVNDKPVKDVLIESCTVQKLAKPYDLPLN